MESGSTKYCTNCKEDIAEGNFIMHEVHCRRNITLCKDCQEPVPRSEMEEHFEEYHKPITCKCGETVEKCKVEEHEKNECAQRIKHCEYCELELPFIQMAEHLNYCGSRTECCPKCQRYIQNRDRDQHDITDCAFPDQKPSIPRQPPPVESLFDNLEDYDETTYHAVTNRFAFPEYVDPNDLDDNMTRPSMRSVNVSSSQFYGGSKDNRSSAQDANPGGRNRRQRKNQDRVQNIYKNTNQRKPVASKKKDSTKQSNTQAADQMEADRLLALSISNEDDQVFGLDNSFDALLGSVQPSNHGNRDFDDSELDQWENDRDAGSPSRRRLASRTSQPSLWSALDENGISGEVVMAPCEFCNKAFPLDDLILHQTGCQMESLDQVLDPSEITSVPSNNQHQTVPQGSTAVQTPVLDNLRKPNLQRLISPEPLHHYLSGSSEDGSVMLPCEFCGDLLPAEFLPHHQFHCRESRPTRSNHEVESALQDLEETPPSPTLVSRSIGRTRNTLGTSSPPKSRSSRRRQEDAMLRNMFPASGFDEVDEGDNRHSSKVKRSLGQADDVSGRTQYSRPPKNKNSNRSGKNVGVKENDVDDYLAKNDVSYVGSHHAGTTLPLKSSNKDLRKPGTKPVSKKFTNSDYANDNLSSDTTSFQRLHQATSKSNTAAGRGLNNIQKKRSERQDSFTELLSQYDNDPVFMREDRDGRSGVKKTNSRKTPNKGAYNTERVAGATGYVPSFGTDSSRNKKTTNPSSVRLAANFTVPTDAVTRVPAGSRAGLEPAISSGISSRPRGTTNRPSSKTRPKVKVTRHPSGPS
ncbi:TRAF-type zinc finger domain-containing protein 1-like isoform X1 [Lytechinus variegatus]|uniref:TRAF-type zinc finger domain-containing protein 1-like isoform X1 n=1 Tax=Lytechinus variegatus TaxID=7654 RepID=UPI001BB1DA2A|nr:TRAF-type zinc finger domain-containing protein 1-like isoform X1 [Lytechinus variegatus]